MKTRLTTIALIAPLLAAGCATGPTAPYPDQPDQSFALDQMRAAGFDDIHDADISSADAEQLDETESSPLTASVFGAANALSPPAGLSSISAGALGFLSWMAMGERNPADGSRVIAWVPTSLAKTPTEARQLVESEVTAAFDAAAAETRLPQGYRWGDTKHYEISNVERYEWLIEGPDCGEAESEAICMYQLSFLKWEYAEDDWIETRAPEALGGAPAWRMTATDWYPGFSTTKRWPRRWESGFPDLALYARMSKELPDWIALYLAPKKVSFRSDDSDKDSEFIGLPILLQGGEAHYFIEPDSQSY